MQSSIGTAWSLSPPPQEACAQMHGGMGVVGLVAGPNWLWQLRRHGRSPGRGGGLNRGRRHHPDEVHVLAMPWTSGGSRPFKRGGCLLGCARGWSYRHRPGSSFLKPCPGTTARTLLTPTAFLAPKGLSGFSILVRPLSLLTWRDLCFATSSVRSANGGGCTRGRHAGQRSSPSILESFRRPGLNS